MALHSRNRRGGWLLLVGLAAIAPSFGADLTVRSDETPLRATCGEEGARIGALKAGVKVRLRFVLSASTNPCYAVTVNLDGRRVSGFVSRDALEGLRPFRTLEKEGLSGSRKCRTGFR